MEYLQSLYVVSKPIMTYMSIKLSILTTTYIGEWYSARLYSINCIGEGITGFTNHFFTFASPTCSGLLLSHVSLLGVFITSVGFTTMTWILYLFNISKQEYKKSEKIIIENIENTENTENTNKDD